MNLLRPLLTSNRAQPIEQCNVSIYLNDDLLFEVINWTLVENEFMSKISDGSVDLKRCIEGHGDLYAKLTIKSQ